MINITVRADVRQAERFYSNLRKNGVKAAAARAINDTLTTVRANGAREIKKAHPALKIGDIKAKMTMKRAHKFNLRGMVATQGAPLSALLFRPTGGKARKRGGAAPVKIMFGTKRGVVEVAGRRGFRIQRYGNEVFVRRFAKGRQVRRFRGPSMPGVFRAQSDEFTAIARARWSAAFRSRLQHEIELAKR